MVSQPGQGPIHQAQLTKGRPKEDVTKKLLCTGWLKLKYATAQNAISRQLCEIFIPKFLDLYGRNPATILKFKKIF